ncbi:MAG: GAF domain-containing sensor histidine kinase [Anaerolineales bacterium]|jgi:signal transduction histidine kinase
MTISARFNSKDIRWTKPARILWVSLAIIAIIMLIVSLPGYIQRFEGQLAHVPEEQMTALDQIFAVLGGVASLVSALLSLLLAWLLYRQRFNSPLPAALSAYLLVYAIVMAGPLEHLADYWLGTVSFTVAIQGTLLGIPTVTLLMLFPDGRFVPSWTRWAFYISIPWGISFLFLPELNATNFARYPILFTGAATGFVLFMILGIYAQIYRYRHVSNSEQRQQTKWAVLGFGLWILYMAISSVPYLYLTSLEPGQRVPWWTGLSELGWWLSLSIIPIALTIATTRYHLWNIDQVINRTLVYTALTGTVIIIYGLLVGGLSLFFRTTNRTWMPIVATGLAAVLFQPLRNHMQGVVNRLMYGERDDPTLVLAKLGRQLEQTGTPESTIDAIVQTIAQTLKLPYVAIKWGDKGETITSYGVPRDRLEKFPLNYQGESIGWLSVAARAPGEPLSSKDQQLLENIARQASAVVHNARLTSDLQRAREHLVASREEERRRIRRDLHDGLGPELASLTLKLDAARNLLASDTSATERLLDELRLQSQNAIAEIRGLVYNLRPPALDELGLIPAVKAHAASIPGGQTPEIHIQGPESLPNLPAAVEVAAYRIALEAINNAQRHSGADNCWVAFTVEDDLTLEITDDGSGFSEKDTAGVGLSSMRERTAELGASLKISSNADTGTRITAAFPLQRSDIA